MNPVQHKDFRREFYKNTLLETYQDIRFCGNVVAHLNNPSNHFDFRASETFPFSGHINWYWQKNKIQLYGGNAVVFVSVSNDFDAEGWNIQPKLLEHNGQKKLLFSITVEETAEGVAQAVAWAVSVFKEIKARTSRWQK